MAVDDVERAWPYHASYVYDFAQKVYDHIGNPFFARLDRIWAFNAIAVLIGSIAALGFRRSGEPGLIRLRSRAWLWASAGLIAVFLMTKYSEPIGRLVPRIEIGVFSWRMMTLTSFVVAMSAWYVAWPMWRGQSFEPNFEHYNYATLPRGIPREAPPMDLARLVSGAGRVTIERWAPELRKLRVELEKPDQLQFRTSNFAGWTAAVDGKLVEIKEGAVKNIVIDLPAGEHTVALDFRSTPGRRVSGWITGLSLALLVSIIVSANRRK